LSTASRAAAPATAAPGTHIHRLVRGPAAPAPPHPPAQPQPVALLPQPVPPSLMLLLLLLPPPPPLLLPLLLPLPLPLLLLLPLLLPLLLLLLLLLRPALVRFIIIDDGGTRRGLDCSSAPGSRWPAVARPLLLRTVTPRLSRAYLLPEAGSRGLKGRGWPRKRGHGRTSALRLDCHHPRGLQPRHGSRTSKHQLPNQYPAPCADLALPH
jgi:hypothetical protein